MLSREVLESYRRMSLAERLKLTMDAIELHMPGLIEGPPEVVARRFILLDRENNARNEGMLKAFSRVRESSCKR